jgi:hypothetical protein
MRGLILVPYNKCDWNAAEQCWMLQDQDTGTISLDFSFIPAWDESHLSEDKFKICTIAVSILCDPKQLSKHLCSNYYVGIGFLCSP